MITEETAKSILKVYGEAWVGQDSDKIISIFRDDGIYHERAFGEPFRGHNEIREYWKAKVMGEQSDIEFRLLNFYISNDTLIAEWEASFNSNVKNARIHIKEVAILEIEENKIKSLREYWQSEKV